MLTGPLEVQMVDRLYLTLWWSLLSPEHWWDGLQLPPLYLGKLQRWTDERIMTEESRSTQSFFIIMWRPAARHFVFSDTEWLSQAKLVTILDNNLPRNLPSLPHYTYTQTHSSSTSYCHCTKGYDAYRQTNSILFLPERSQTHTHTQNKNPIRQLPRLTLCWFDCRWKANRSRLSTASQGNNPQLVVTVAGMWYATMSATGGWVTSKASVCVSVCVCVYQGGVLTQQCGNYSMLYSRTEHQQCRRWQTVGEVYENFRLLLSLNH